MRSERIDTSLARLRRLIKRTAGSFALVRVVADDAARGDVLSVMQGLREEGQALRVLPDGAEGASALEGALRGVDGPCDGMVVPDADALVRFDDGRVLDGLNLARDRLSSLVRGPLVLVLSPRGDAALAVRAPDLRDATLGLVRVEAGVGAEMDAPFKRATWREVEAELSRILSAEMSDGEAVDALVWLAKRWHHSSQMDPSDHADRDRQLTERIAGEAQRRAERSGYVRGIANAMVLRAMSNGQRLVFEQRRQLIEDAIQRLQAIGLSADFDLLGARSSLASVLMQNGHVDEGLRLFEAEIIPAVDSSFGVEDQISAREALATNLHRLGHAHDAARLTLEEIVPLARRAGQTSAEVRQLALGAAYLVGASRYDEAITILRDEVVPKARAAGDDLDLAFAYATLAEAAEHRGGSGDLSQATLYADFAKRLYAKVGEASAVKRMDEILKRLAPTSPGNRAERRRARFARQHF